MKNLTIPRTTVWTWYTWIQSGITSYTGNAYVQNRLDSGVLIGAIAHCSFHNSIWIQESYSKVVTVALVNDGGHRLYVQLVARQNVGPRSPQDEASRICFLTQIESIRIDQLIVQLDR